MRVKLISIVVASLFAQGAYAQDPFLWNGSLEAGGRGTNIDDRGIHPVPAPSAVDAPWHRVADLRPERRGGRTRVAVYLDSGEIALLTAPYDGRLLGRDREFERKLIMLRHLWDTHRRAAPPAG